MAYLKPQRPVVNWGHPLTKGLGFDSSIHEGVGTIVKDNYTNKNGITTGSNIWGESIYGSVLNLDGSSNFVTIAPNPVNFQDNIPFTISALIKTTLGTVTTIIGTWNFMSTAGLRFAVNGNVANKLDLLMSTSNGSNTRQSSGATTVNDGLWHHVVTTYDGTANATGIKFFVDGNSDTATINGVNNANPGTLDNTNLFIGKIAGGTPQYYSGSIGLVRVWNRVLTPGEVRRLYTNPWQIYMQPDTLKFNSVSVSITSGLKTERSSQEILNMLYGSSSKTTFSEQEIANIYHGSGKTTYSLQQVLNIRKSQNSTLMTEQEAIYANLKSALSLSGTNKDYTTQELLNLAYNAGLGLTDIFL